MTILALVTALIASGHLEDMAGDACEVCGDGLYSLKSKREEGKAENVVWRCSEYGWLINILENIALDGYSSFLIKLKKKSVIILDGYGSFLIEFNKQSIRI